MQGSGKKRQMQCVSTRRSPGIERYWIPMPSSSHCLPCSSLYHRSRKLIPLGLSTRASWEDVWERSPRPRMTCRRGYEQALGTVPVQDEDHFTDNSWLRQKPHLRFHSSKQPFQDRSSFTPNNSFDARSGLHWSAPPSPEKGPSGPAAESQQKNASSQSTHAPGAILVPSAAPYAFQRRSRYSSAHHWYSGLRPPPRRPIGRSSAPPQAKNRRNLTYVPGRTPGEQPSACSG